MLIDMTTVKRIPVMRLVYVPKPEKIQEDVLEFLEYYYVVSGLDHEPFPIQAKMIAEAQLLAETWNGLLAR